MTYRPRLQMLAFLLAISPVCLAENPPATAPPSAASHTPLKPRKDVKGVGNFAQVSTVLYRGEQPTEEGFKNLKQMGVRTIIDLRDNHDDLALMKGNGFNYLHISCTCASFTEADVLAFFKTLSDPANQPVFVHCERGADRTGLMVACYRMAEQGWTIAEALKELPNFKFEKSKVRVTEYINAFDAATFKPKIESAPVPKIERVD